MVALGSDVVNFIVLTRKSEGNNWKLSKKVTYHKGFDLIRFCRRRINAS